MSVDGSAGGPNKHANCTNKNPNKVQGDNNVSHNSHSVHVETLLDGIIRAARLEKVWLGH